MNQDYRPLFEALWKDFLNLTPSAMRIHQLLGGGEQVINDHIALRTYGDPRVDLPKLAQHFEAVGYQCCGDYHFAQKKLRAHHYEHPDPEAPKVFISELILEECSDELQQRVAELLEGVDASVTESPEFLWSGAPWQASIETYQSLLKESEYAAWLAAFGFRANHFTVDVNRLTNFASLEEVNQTLSGAGFPLNLSGGAIKGSPEVLLEQSSILADPVEVHFSDGASTIPGCFYEFARRYPKADGELYTGFVAASADKLFESTDTQS
ncbi:DUF1338 domain-containing protein [Dongshaea marina]|uniref:DUF1338 domain-containing protein n=1 Tax=Dongshaea marina TaxID=2047966 RepID=UPI000D3EC860|nr:DUF1338 domain-containing protein [Dongshaea marina]